MKAPPMVYIAAPLSSGDQIQNHRRAIDAAEALHRVGLVPFVPHNTRDWHFAYPKPEDVWMLYDMAFLVKCDAVCRLSGVSKGADLEVIHASKLKIPVYYSVDATIRALSRAGKI